MPMQRKDSDEVGRYIQTTPKSRALYEEAQRYLPGGDSRNTAYWPPYPVFLDRGQGCRVWDVDGNERLDFINNMTSLILGHAHPAVVAAIEAQARKGTSFAAPTELQVKLAEILCHRIPSLERVRFTNSGTEATMNCLRAAHAFTRRRKIAKCEGGYHGSHDWAAISVHPSLPQAGDPKHPTPVPDFPGLPQEVVDQVVVLPYNDPQAAEAVLWKHRQGLAAVIVEPVMGSSGMVPADRQYLALLREVTHKCGALLIFDEVISFRVAPGGAQQYYGIQPDLTALGKIIGGGLPVGAFGGRQDVMSLFDPSSGPQIPHAGTFNANPLTLAAGVATLEHLTPDVYTRLASLAERLRQGVRAVCTALEVPVQVTGLGSLFALHFTSQPVRSYRDTLTVDPALRHRVFLGLLNEGVLCSSHLLGALSTPMGEAEVDTFVTALRTALERVR